MLWWCQIDFWQPASRVLVIHIHCLKAGKHGKQNSWFFMEQRGSYKKSKKDIPLFHFMCCSILNAKLFFFFFLDIYFIYFFYIPRSNLVYRDSLKEENLAGYTHYNYKVINSYFSKTIMTNISVISINKHPVYSDRSSCFIFSKIAKYFLWSLEKDKRVCTDLDTELKLCYLLQYYPIYTA